VDETQSAATEQATIADSAAPDPARGSHPESRATPGVIAPPAAHSLLRYAPALMLLLVVVADSVQYADTDTWGHVLFGRIMLNSGHLMRHEIFSYSAPDGPWIDHEWLSEIVMAIFYNAMGVVGLKLMKFLCAGATLLLLGAAVAESGAGTSLQMGVLLAVAFALQLQIQFRPQLFDYIFLSALLALFARARSRGRAPLWIVVPMMALWANLHGGFFIGIVVLGLYAGTALLIDLWNGAGPARGLRFLLLALAASLITLVNPYGAGEWRIVAHTLRNPYTMSAGVEFQSFFHVVAGTWRSGLALFPFLVALGVMAAFVVSFALAPCADDLPEVAIAGLMVLLALYSVRNMAFAMLACAGPIAFHAHRALARIAPAQSADAVTTPRRHPPPHASPGVQLCALIAALAICIGDGLFSPRLPDFTGYPVGAVAFMRQHRLQGRILNEFLWGSYILWHAPDSKVFIDGRFEMVYPPDVQRAYLDFIRGGAGAGAALAAYPPDYVLVRPDSTAATFMGEQSDWRLIYRDPVAVLFARADAPAAHMQGVPIVRDFAPPSLFP